MTVSLTRVLNYMPGVNTKRVLRWKDPDDRTLANDRWDGIWTDEVKMQAALDIIEWLPGSTIPTPEQVIAAKPARESFEVAAQAAAPKNEIEHQLRTNPEFKANVALRARDENKTIDQIIAETIAKV